MKLSIASGHTLLPDYVVQFTDQFGTVYFAEEGFPGWYTSDPKRALRMTRKQAFNVKRYAEGLGALGVTVHVMKRSKVKR